MLRKLFSKTELPINEIFETMQGEGAWSGTPSTFIRVQGCPVGCPWCDTKYTWPMPDKAQREPNVLVVLQKDGKDPRDSFSFIASSEIANYCLKLKPRHVVITGGEPCMYDLEPLTYLLTSRYGFSVQVETSGTFEPRVSKKTWLTVSPKMDMPGGYKVLASAMWRANEIKHPIGKPEDVLKLLGLLRGNRRRPGTHIFLQPLSQNETATRLCVSAASEQNWRISPQIHKYLGLR